MRIGIIAAIIFIMLGTGVIAGSIENESLINAKTQARMESMMSATKVIEEDSFGGYFTLLAAPFIYFDSIVQSAWAIFDTPIFTNADGSPSNWAAVPYFVISPLIVVLFFGLIILLIGILQKNI